MENGMLREKIRSALTRRAGTNPDANAFAEATLGAWQDVAVRLSPVIGAGGVDALFRRALYLASATYSWMAIAEDDGNSAGLLAAFKRHLAARETTVAAEAGCILLVTFTELLETLIGKSLTERLLNPVWGETPAPDEESTS
jgi:hypothetical protein